MELVEQNYTLRPNRSLKLIYRLSGDLSAVADLSPSTTTTTTSTTTTTTTTSTVPDDESASADRIR